MVYAWGIFVMFGIGTWLWYNFVTWLSEDHSCIWFSLWYGFCDSYLWYGCSWLTYRDTHWSLEGLHWWYGTGIYKLMAYGTCYSYDGCSSIWYMIWYMIGYSLFMLWYLHLAYLLVHDWCTCWYTFDAWYGIDYNWLMMRQWQK